VYYVRDQVGIYDSPYRDKEKLSVSLCIFRRFTGRAVHGTVNGQ
jgi:hypothetical protein